MKIIRTVFIFLTLTVTFSCSYLDFDETNGLQGKEDVYKYFDKTKQVLTNVYSYIPQDFGALDGAMRDCATDDALWGNPTAPVQRFTNGSWSAINTYDTGWGFYNGIRAANEFIASVATVDFSRYQTDPNYENWMEQLKYFSHEARALRAFYIFELAKRYGDIAMPTHVLTTDEANSIGKTTFEDAVGFIVSECDECASILPASYENQPYKELGRVTKGFAMALKTKALLYAASPLHNPKNDKELWKKAARAALELIDSGLYSLETGDKCNNISSRENIFVRMNGNSSSFEANCFPLRFMYGSRGSVQNCIYPTENLASAFRTVNGFAVTLTRGGYTSADPKFNPKKPYSNRDPRMTRTLVCDGSVFKGAAIETSKGGQDAGEVLQGYTPTGYYLRKYVIENTSFDPNAKATYRHHWVVFRYAETLLSYAEAMVESFGNPDYSDDEFTRSAAWALNRVRKNAGMPECTEKVESRFMDEVRNEWRVEFAFEDHRFWDVRRWMLGPDTQIDIYGVSIVKSGSDNTYSQKDCGTRKWNNRMNLYPIPQSELAKNSHLEPQNKGW